MDPVLYAISPEYRRCIDRLHRIEQAHGALEAAYRNALGEKRQLQAHVQSVAEHLQTICRDQDPGTGGSGGQVTPDCLKRG